MEENIENKEYLNMAQTAHLLGISEKLMRKLSHQQDFPCIRFENRVVISKKLLDSWFANNSNRFIK